MNITKLHKFANKCYLKKIPIIPVVIGRLIRIFFSAEIPYSADIHPTVVFSHNALGVVIGHDTIIGKNTKILQNVTIGGRNGIRANPIIGENVLIGAGACILGPVTIGDNVKIGANAVVITDIPDNKTAVGVPARIIKKL